MEVGSIGRGFSGIKSSINSLESAAAVLLITASVAVFDANTVLSAVSTAFEVTLSTMSAAIDVELSSAKVVESTALSQDVITSIGSLVACCRTTDVRLRFLMD